MALELNVSNSLEELSRQLASDIEQSRFSVFQPLCLITQTEGMNSWLKLQLAGQLGIAANFRFLTPNELVLMIFHLLGGHYHPGLGRQGQSWILFHLLARPAFTQRYKDIAAYYSGSSKDSDLKRLALAGKLADLFDQYQVYRPEMIRSWNQGRPVGLRQERWQMELWREAKKVSEGSFTDKTEVSDAIHRALQDPARQQLLRSRLPAVRLVGMSVLTDYHMELFDLVGRYIDISFYMLNPAPLDYWFEDKSEKQVAFLKRNKLFEPYESSTGNALLTGWGKVLQDTFRLLFQNEALVNAYQETGLKQPEEDTLLGKLQADLFFNRDAQLRAELRLEDLQDGSLSIHSNYTVMREVEALYNFLLQLVDEKKEQFSARDIVVMVSDIDAYAPYIKAVFQHAPYSFPFTIADGSGTAEDSLSGALLSVLEMDEAGFKAEAIMQLLDSRFIKKRFGIEDLSAIRRAVDQAGFRFGIDGTMKDESLLVSWSYARKRIIYGLCIQGGEEYFGEGESFFPLDTLEGEQAGELIRFCHFMDVLVESIQQRKTKRTLSEWASYVETVLHELVFSGEDSQQEAYAELVKKLIQFNEAAEISPERVPYSLFLHSLKSAAQLSETAGSFASSGITFCSLIPMRSIPFKVVAVLGLNFDTFPRKENRLRFNLMEQQRKKGDRNIKENDKHLFLETLLSAKDYLYLSYLGRSVKDNTPLPPSSLIDELLEYLQAGAPGIPVQEILVFQHPLSSYSQRYRRQDCRYTNYLALDTAGTLNFLAEKAPPAPDFSTVGVDELLSFFKHPLRGYFNRILTIFYRDEDVLLAETERFELTRLDEHLLKTDLLPLSGPEQLPELRNQLVKLGNFPLRNMADLLLSKQEEQVAAVREMYQACRAEREASALSIQIELPEINTLITGQLQGFYQDRLLQVCWSKNENKHLIEAYLRYLLVRAAGQESELYYISAQKGKIIQAQSLSVQQARERLLGLLQLYRSAHAEPLAFSADLKINPENLAELDETKFTKTVEQTFNNAQFSFSDPYLSKAYAEGIFSGPQAFAAYLDAAGLLLLPLMEIFPAHYE